MEYSWFKKSVFLLLDWFHTRFYSSNWDQKSKTRISYWWSCISSFAHVFRVKNKRTHSPTIHSPIIHSPTWKLKQNKCTRKCSKKENTPRNWWFKSNQFIKRIHVLTSFCLASDPQRKIVSLAYRSIWKRPNSRQPVFRPEVPPAPIASGWQAREESSI